MILSGIAGRRAPRATRADYVRDWLAGLDDGVLLSDSGEPLIPESALRVAVIYRSINVIAHAVAGVPLITYERLSGDARRAAVETPTYRLLHDTPNAWMTSFRWRHHMVTRALLSGDAYYQLMPGPGGISQIVPLEPSTTKPVDQLASGKLLYVTRDLTKAGYGPERRLVQDEVLHVSGLSVDGKRGVPLMDVARNAIGLALSAEKHGSMFLRNGQRFAGILTMPGSLEDDARKENEEAWQRAYGGAGNSGGTPLLEGGMEYKPISANNVDSQWIEARTFQVEELLRFLGVPGVLVGYSDKTSTYASAEQFFLSFVKFTVSHWTDNIKAELNKSVVIQPRDAEPGEERYFAEFDLDGLQKGDIKTRYDAHHKAILSGWKSRNEVRREENYDPGPEELDEFLEPTNMAPAGSQGVDASEEQPRRRTEERALRSLPVAAAPQERPIGHVQFVVDAAARVVRREIAAIRGGGGGKMGLAVRYARDKAAFEREARKYYASHVTYVAATMHIEPSQAEAYVEEQLATVLAEGVAAMSEEWERDRTAALAFTALGE